MQSRRNKLCVIIFLTWAHLGVIRLIINDIARIRFCVIIILFATIVEYRQIDYICLSKKNSMSKAEQRKSVYRIFSDLVKQDNLITAGEIGFLNLVCKEYGITEDDRVGGHMMTLADAISTLQGETLETRKDIVRKMEKCAVKDNVCCREESLLITAVRYCCGDSQQGGAYVRSFPAATINIRESQLIYLETESASGPVPGLMSDAEQYSDFCAICRLGGFEYVYIPKVAEHFREFDDKETLKEVVSLVSPSLRKDEINAIILLMSEMSTSFFYRKVLRDKLQLPIMIDRPVWMFKVGNSVVGGQDYVNFLCVEVDDSPKAQLRNLMNEITSRQSSSHLVISKTENDSGRFEYDGFYRTLLDMMAIKKVSAPDITIHTLGHEVVLNGKKAIISGMDSEGNRFPVTMDRREAAFYVLLLCACAEGGRGIEMSFVYDGKGRRVLKGHFAWKKRYEVIYNELSNWASVPDMTCVNILRPTRSYIAKSIRNTPELSPLALYLPIERNGCLGLSLEADHVKVQEKGKECKLLDSELYTRFKLAAGGIR